MRATGAPRCQGCGAVAVGAGVERLRDVNDELRRLQAERERLVAQLTVPPAAERVPDAGGVPLADLPPPSGPPVGAAVRVPPAAPPPPAAPFAAPPPPSAAPLPAPPAPAPVRKHLPAQTLLAIAGAALLGAAAVVFAAVTWTRLPELLQLAILVAVAGLAGAGARLLEVRSIRIGAGALAVLAVVVAAVVGWAVADGSADVTITVAAVAAALLLLGSTLTATRVVAVLLAALLPLAWLGPVIPTSGWAAASATSAIASLSVAAVAVVTWLLRPGAGIPVLVVVTGAVVAAPHVLVAVVAALVTAAAPEVPGLGIALVAPVVAVARVAARRWRWLAAPAAFLATTAVAATVAAAGTQIAVAYLAVAVPVLAALVWLEREPLAVPGVVGTAAVAVLRVDLAVEPVARALGRVGAAVAGVVPPGGGGGRVLAALAAVAVLLVAVLWVARPTMRVADPVRTAAAGAAVALVLVVDPAVAVAVVAVVLLAVVWLPAPPVTAVLGRRVVGSAAGVLTPLAVAAVVVSADLPRVAGLADDVSWQALAGIAAVVVLAPLAAGTRRLPVEIGAWGGTGFLAMMLLGDAVAAPSDRLVGWALGTALVAVAAGLAAAAARAVIRWWAAGAAATVSAWAWLVVAEVTVPEAYVAAPAVVLLLAGAIAMHREPARSSWAALLPGLVIAVAPTALLLLADPDHLARTLGLLAAGVGLAGIGWLRRLGAPLVVGVLAAGEVAVLQLWAVVDLAPRWVALTLAGGVLLWAAITYEAQVARGRRLFEHVGSLR